MTRIDLAVKHQLMAKTVAVLVQLKPDITVVDAVSVARLVNLG